MRNREEQIKWLESIKADFKDILENIGWSKQQLYESFQTEVAISSSCHLKATKAPSPSFCYENAPNIVTIDVEETTKIQQTCSQNSPTHSIENYSNQQSILQRSSVPVEVPQQSRKRCQEYSAEVIFSNRMRQSRPGQQLILSGCDIWTIAEEIDRTVAKYQEQAKEAASKRSQLEVLAEERDYKRRRQSYRAKNVHMTKRTPTQVLRDMIAARMNILEQIHEDSVKTKRSKRR